MKNKLELCLELMRIDIDFDPSTVMAPFANKNKFENLTTEEQFLLRVLSFFADDVRFVLTSESWLKAKLF